MIKPKKNLKNKKMISFNKNVNNYFINNKQLDN